MKSCGGVRLSLAFMVFGLLLGSGLYAVENVAPFEHQSARENAMGGVHSALADDFSSLFSNPAGFAGAREELSFAELTTTVYGPVFDIIDSVQTYLGPTEKLDISDLIGPAGFNAGADITGPLSFGWVGRGLGFGLFNRSTVHANAPGTSLSAMASEDLMMVGGYAFRFSPSENHLFDVGFLGKGYIRGSLSLSASIFTVTDLASGNPMEDKPFFATAGVGLDLGLRYEYRSLLTVAVVCHDAYSPSSVSEYTSAMDFISGDTEVVSTEYGLISPRLDAGISFTPRFAALDRYFSGLIFLLDYRDFLDLLNPIPRNPILNAAIGMELVVLDALSLRAGIADALPSLGLGLDLTFMRMDFAMRGMELGLDPGKNPTFAFDLGLLFRY